MIPLKVTTETLVHFILTIFWMLSPLHVISGLELADSPLLVTEASSFVVFTNVSFPIAGISTDPSSKFSISSSLLVMLSSFSTIVLLDS